MDGRLGKTSSSDWKRREESRRGEEEFLTEQQKFFLRLCSINDALRLPLRSFPILLLLLFFFFCTPFILFSLLEGSSGTGMVVSIQVSDPRSSHLHLLLLLTFALFTKEELTKPQGAPLSAKRANRIWLDSMTGASADLRALLRQPAPLPAPTPPTPSSPSSLRPVWSWERNG